MAAQVSRAPRPSSRARTSHCGWLGRVPLPPLKAVRRVRRSRPLRKSPYSFRALTATWAARAPSSTSRASNVASDFPPASAMPSATQLSVSGRNRPRATPSQAQFSLTIALRYPNHKGPFSGMRRTRVLMRIGSSVGQTAATLLQRFQQAAVFGLGAAAAAELAQLLAQAPQVADARLDGVQVLAHH